MADHNEKESTKQWLEEWYAVADACVPANSVKWFSTDCTVRFNNQQAVYGLKATQELFTPTAASIDWMKHHIVDIDIVGNRVYNECIVEMAAANDPEKKVAKMHRMDVYERVPQGEPEEGQIRKWTAYFDAAPFRERVLASSSSGSVY